ncbi:MAG: TIGR01777 family oxidoreductase [Acidimicrobiales bacterium]
MRIAVTGASGLIGRALVTALGEAGDDVRPLVRRQSGPGEIGWDPTAGRLDPRALAGIDAVVHLAGAGIGDRRWTDARKQIVLRSRVESTALLARTVASMDNPPKAMVSASAIGYYGDRGDETLTETSAAGSGFQAEVCQAWEQATAPAESAGIRVVHLRSAVVLSRRGGALGRQLPLFRLGLGGRLGSGRQWLSWISLRDEVAVIRRAIDDAGLVGPVNAAAPAPVTNREFTRALGRALHRPAVLAVPPVVLRLVLGRDLADELLLGSVRVVPAKLTEARFPFEDPRLDSALSVP